jgi:membrane protease YdiL (CAAX protease family)
MKLLQKIWSFLTGPRYQNYDYPSLLKRRVFLNLLAWNVVIAMTIGFLVGILQTVLRIDVGQHDIEQLLEEYSPLTILFLAFIVAPIVEETIFRAPLIWFKKSKYFSLALYMSIFLFGLIHLFNYADYGNALWFAPLLFLPQLITGVFLSFIRVRMGLSEAMLFHALFNLILLGPILILESINPQLL